MKKSKRWVCKKYTDWVKTLPSVMSLFPSDDPHHITGVIKSGMGMRIHDLFTIPLTRDEHQKIHLDQKLLNKQLNTNQAEECIKTINQALNEGLIEIKWVGK